MQSLTGCNESMIERIGESIDVDPLFGVRRLVRDSKQARSVALRCLRSVIIRSQNLGKPSEGEGSFEKRQAIGGIEGREEGRRSHWTGLSAPAVGGSKSKRTRDGIR
ncbi:MAG: hypothetical protein ISN28_09910 [Ectothiorhodospiraceae bacterium AqS1]|nr:hypothetical protein [Ectothiorhodospiraceae bacterium AqS1]